MAYNCTAAAAAVAGWRHRGRARAGCQLGRQGARPSRCETHHQDAASHQQRRPHHGEHQQRPGLRQAAGRRSDPRRGAVRREVLESHAECAGWCACVRFEAQESCSSCWEDNWKNRLKNKKNRLDKWRPTCCFFGGPRLGAMATTFGSLDQKKSSRSLQSSITAVPQSAAWSAGRRSCRGLVLERGEARARGFRRTLLMRTWHETQEARRQPQWPLLQLCFVW